MERDARDMQKLIQTVKEVRGTEDVIVDIGRLSEEWDLSDDEYVFTVRIFSIL